MIKLIYQIKDKEILQMNPFRLHTKPFGDGNVTSIRTQINGITDEEIIELLNAVKHEYRKIDYDLKHSIADIIQLTIIDYRRIQQVVKALHQDAINEMIVDTHTLTCRIKRHSIQAGYSVSYAERLAKAYRNINCLTTHLVFDDFAIKDKETFHIRLEQLKIDTFSSFIFVIALEQNHNMEQERGLY